MDNKMKRSVMYAYLTFWDILAEVGKQENRFNELNKLLVSTRQYDLLQDLLARF